MDRFPLGRRNRLRVCVHCGLDVGASKQFLLHRHTGPHIFDLPLGDFVWEFLSHELADREEIARHEFRTRSEFKGYLGRDLGETCHRSGRIAKPQDIRGFRVDIEAPRSFWPEDLVAPTARNSPAMYSRQDSIILSRIALRRDSEICAVRGSRVRVKPNSA